MAIEINGLQGGQSQAAQNSGQAERAGDPARDTAKQPVNSDARQGDTVQLTNAARQLSELESRISAQPVVDARRVADVSRSIDNGSLEINPSSIATNLIRFESYLA